MGRRNSRLTRLLLLAAVAAFVVTCTDSPVRPGGFEGPLFAVWDGASGGNPDVFFLPPLMDSPSGDPDFGDRLPNDMLAPYARVCELNYDDSGLIPPPDTLACVGAVWDLPMTYGDGFYHANLKDIPDEITPDSPHLRIAIVLGEPNLDGSMVGRLELAYRDVNPQGEPSRECTGDDEFCGYNVNGSGGLPVKVVIETGAVCWALDNTLTNDELNECVAATLSVGGSLAFPYDGTTVGVASVDAIGGAASATISIQTCDDLRDITKRPTADEGRVDLPTFGICLVVTNANDPLEVFGTVTHCDAFDEATAPVSEGGGGLSHEAAERMTVHRFTPGDGTYAMPHAQYHSDCAEAAVPGGQAFEFTKFERMVRLARQAWRAVGNQLLALIEPDPAWACHDGGCAGAGPFRSDFQVAQPAWMGFGVNPGSLDAITGWWNLGAYDVGTVVTAKVQAQDSGEDHDGSVGTPEPVAKVRLSVTVNGVYSGTILTGPDGVATFDLTVGPGTNTVVISGIGVGTEGLTGTVHNVFAPSLTTEYDPDEQSGEVKLGEGTLTFTAFGLVPLHFVPEYPELFMMDEDGLSASLPGFNICTVDGELLEGIPFKLVAVNNNGSWVELEYDGDAVPKYPDDAFLAGLATGPNGCFVSTELLTINKTGAYRLVLNPVFNERDKVVGGEAESPKFNVKPFK